MLDPKALLALLSDWQSQVTLPAILNLDLVYLFGPGTGDVAIRVLDDHYADALADAITALDRAGAFWVITMALTATDDLTAGWGGVEALAQRFCKALGQTFALP